METREIALLLFAVGFAGALPPLFRRWSDRRLHLFVSLSAGIFLGTIFLHLLPHLAGVRGEEGHVHAEEVSGSIAPWIAALAGLLVLFFVERVWLRSVIASAGADPHRVLWAATYLGLGLHSLTTGVALNAILAEPAVRAQFLASILIHKATEAFSLASVMRLAGLRGRQAVPWLVVFAAIEPAALLFGRGALVPGAGVGEVLTGFACGTFLYVALCDLLPEVFHEVERPILKVLAVGAGILSTAVTVPRLEHAAVFGRVALERSWEVFVDLAPYLLAGFLVAGLLHAVLKPRWFVRRMARDDLRSVGFASLIGAPLPLCSCAVVPVAIELRREGASKGATAAFLTATPETGVDSVGVSWALLDPLLTVARPVGAILSAIASGCAVNWLVRSGLDRDPVPRVQPEAAEGQACCAHDHPAERGSAPEPERAAAPPPAAPPPARRSLSGALRYAFVDMLDDLAPSLVFGILLAGVIAAVVPDEVFLSPLAQGFGGMLLMLVVGIPIYVCASASTPIAAALILKGMSPGTALVFLLASPATNAGSLVVLARQLGVRAVLVQVLALAATALALGLAVDELYEALGIAPSAAAGAAPELPAAVALPAAFVLAALLAASIARTALARLSHLRPPTRAVFAAERRSEGA